jgi:uncharacterized protein (TIGR00255 family)
MTAFARAEDTEKEISVLVEIRSYNSRHLDIVLHVPHRYLAFEEKIKGLVSNQISRGRIEINLQIREDVEQAKTFEINVPKAKAYFDSLIQLKEQLNIDSELSLDLLVGMGDIIKPAEMDRDMEAYWSIVENCINQALDDLVTMRTREGEYIGKDIADRLDDIENNINQIEEESEGILDYYKNRLEERISVLTKGVVEIDPDRVAQEAAFFADRSDISEEIVRGRSHINQFKTIMNSTEPAGRKLSFLLQELNREFNTIGSKTEKTNVSHTVVAVKSELEKIREQLRNVE